MASEVNKGNQSYDNYYFMIKHKSFQGQAELNFEDFKKLDINKEQLKSNNIKQTL